MAAVKAVKAVKATPSVVFVCHYNKCVIGGTRQAVQAALEWSTALPGGWRVVAREWRVPTVNSQLPPVHQSTSMQVKMVATTGRLPVIETPLLDMEDLQVRLTKLFEQ